MEKNQSSLIPNVNGIYSDSEFLNYLSDQVSWSDSNSSVSLRNLRVFLWSQRRLIEFNTEGNNPIKEKIKSALGFLDFHYIPTLVQFWAPKKEGSFQFLETFEFPFGISSLRKGLCWYRKKCLNYKYRVDGESDEEDYGPIGRVFLNGFPEFSPNVSLYSAKENKLRDFAITCGLKGYLALPVFDINGQHCVGVLELISIWDGSYCLTNKIEKVEEALQAVGLRSSKICSPFDIELSSQHEIALSEIKKILEAACCAHRLPFAQAWFCSQEKNLSWDFLCTSEKGSFVLAKSVLSFQKECLRLNLKKGENVVWRAFASGTSCFCKDIKQLRILEYPFVNLARKFDLSSCFAICLQTRQGSGSDIYVLEFFLSSVQLIDRDQPQSFLALLLATVKKKLSQSFKVASGLELGTELSVEVIKLPTDNEVNSFKIYPVPTSAEISQDQVKSSYSENSKINCHGKDRNTAGETNGSRSRNLHKRKADDGTEVVASDKRNTGHSLSWQEEYVKESKDHNVELLPQTNQTNSTIMIKAIYKEDIIKFQFPVTAGMKDFQNEVEKRLQLNPGSYEIHHLNNDDFGRSISLISDDAELQNFLRTMVSLKKGTVKLVLVPVVKIQNRIPMFIKVVYDDDTIKFQLSASAGIMEFKNEVMKRIVKLKSKDFGIKYVNEENEWISVDSDTDLQSYMSKMRSKEVRTVRFFLDSITNP